MCGATKRKQKKSVNYYFEKNRNVSLSFQKRTRSEWLCCVKLLFIFGVLLFNILYLGCFYSRHGHPTLQNYSKFSSEFFFSGNITPILTKTLNLFFGFQKKNEEDSSERLCDPTSIERPKTSSYIGQQNYQ